MSDARRPGPGPPPSPADRVDQACDRFEAAWRAGRRPRIEDYLGAVPVPERTVLLRELIAAELELHRAGGERPELAEYAARFPGDATLLGRLSDGPAATHPGLTFPGPGASTGAGPDDPAPRPGPRAWPPAAAGREAVDAAVGCRAPSAVPGGRTLAGDADPIGPTRSPLVVPGYEVLGELGRGGMGVVYRARQVRLNRPLRLKMILAGDLAGREAAVRFLAEAETVARLRHPNIVQIHALGDHDGRPYLELEYVEGGSLAARLDGTPWPPRRAAALVEPLARAMAESHRLGVVHRDLKPANVLLEADGTPKVADFGLAKAVGLDGSLTQSGAILGSPSYMAPEQAGGLARQVTQAADVYALGAILYELLTGRPPFKAATVSETLAQVRSAEPVSPGRLQPRLPRDLETICLKCLRKEPPSRYDSAAALAEDLRRFLGGEPIRARPVGAAGRLGRWGRRHPAVAGLTASVAALLVTLAVGGILTSAREARASLQLRAARDRAQVRYALARDAVAAYYKGASSDVLLRSAEFRDLRRSLLRAPLEFYRRLAADLEADSTADASARSDLARAYADLARITRDVGAGADALGVARRSLGLFQRLAGERPGDRDVIGALAESYRDVGLMERDLGRSDEALLSLRAAQQAWRALTDADPGRPDVRDALARSHGNLGMLLQATGHPAEALREYRGALEIERALVEAHPESATYQGNLARALAHISQVQAEAGQLAEALRSHEQSHEIRVRLAAADPGDQAQQDDLAGSYGILGDLRADSGHPEDALRSYERALAINETLVAARPNATAPRRHLANNLNAIGIVYDQTRRPAEALRAYGRARALQEALVAANPDVLQYQNDLATSLVNIGLIHVAAGRPGEALPLYQRSLSLREALVRADLADVDARNKLAWTYSKLGVLFAGAGRAAEAEAAFRRALALQEDLVREHPGGTEYRSDLADSHRGLGLLLVGTGRPAEAASALRRSLEARETLADATPDGLYDLACLYSQYGALLDRGRAGPAPGARAEGRTYADRAMGALRRAADCGLTDAARMQRDPDLELLRPRPDFQALLRDVAFPADPFAP